MEKKYLFRQLLWYSRVIILSRSNLWFCRSELELILIIGDSYLLKCGFCQDGVVCFFLFCISNVTQKPCQSTTYDELIFIQYNCTLFFWKKEIFTLSFKYRNNVGFVVVGFSYDARIYWISVQAKIKPDSLSLQ